MGSRSMIEFFLNYGSMVGEILPWTTAVDRCCGPLQWYIVHHAVGDVLFNLLLYVVQLSLHDVQCTTAVVHSRGPLQWSTVEFSQW
jgi:hypothetical protein